MEGRRESKLLMGILVLVSLWAAISLIRASHAASHLELVVTMGSASEKQSLECRPGLASCRRLERRLVEVQPCPDASGNQPVVELRGRLAGSEIDVTLDRGSRCSKRSYDRLMPLILALPAA